MILLLVLARAAFAGGSPELDLCRAAEAGDLAGVRDALARGAGLDGHRETLSPGDALIFGAATALTGGALPVAYALSRGPNSTRALDCALRAQPMSRPVVEAILAAGPLPSPDRRRPLGGWLVVHGDDPDALEQYTWLRAQGLARPADLTPYLQERGGELSPLWRTLLDSGVDIRPCEAARAGDLPVLRALGVDGVTCRDPDLPMRPATLLDVAVRFEREAAAAWLIENGADPSRAAAPSPEPSAFPPEPPLAYALRSGSADMVGLLLRAGADPLGRDAQGRSFLERFVEAPALLPAALSALPPTRAVPYALLLAGDTTPAVRAAVEGWMPPRLRALAARPDVQALDLGFWGEALADAPLEEVLDVLDSPRGARAGDLSREQNPCLPWPGTRRRELGARLPGWRALPGVAVVFDAGRVVETRLTDAEGLRRAGCDAPLLRAVEVPRWQADWEYDLVSARGVRREGATVVLR